MMLFVALKQLWNNLLRNFVANDVVVALKQLWNNFVVCSCFKKDHLSKCGAPHFSIFLGENSI